MASKNTVKVLIDGKIITLSGYESEEYLQRVASYLNNKLTELGPFRVITASHRIPGARCWH